MATPTHENTVTRLHVEDFMRVRSIDITPDATGLVELHGGNAQGKSSLLRAMWSALGGRNESPPKPVREGAEKATARVELGDLIVERTWRPDGKSTLEVFNRDGATYSRPQARLNALISRVAFDPIAFIRMDPKKQAELLAKVAGIDTTAAEEKVAQLYAERHAAGKVVEQAKARVGEEPEKPAKLMDTAALSKELARIDELAEEVSKNGLALDENARAGSDAVDQRAKIEEEIASLQRKVTTLTEQITDLGIQRRKLEEAAQVTLDKAKECRAREEVFNEIEGAQEAATNAERWEQWSERRKEVRDAETRHAMADEAVTEARRELAELVQSGTYPIAGLAVSQEGVQFDGVPLEQASSAEQLKVSMAMAMATNPDLKIVHIKEGSLLDTSSLEVVRSMAADNGFQVWVEVVDDQGLRGLVIEDGELRDDSEPEPAANQGGEA